MQHLSKNKKGEWGENQAVGFLLLKGYEVFPNNGPQGEVDLIGLKDISLKLFQVKCESFRSKDGSKISRSLSERQKKLGVEFIFVNDKGECRIEKD